MSYIFKYIPGAQRAIAQVSDETVHEMRNRPLVYISPEKKDGWIAPL